MNISSRWMVAAASASLAAAAHGQCEPEIVLTIPGTAYSTTIDGTLAYVASGCHGLRILDISEPMAPALLGSVDTPCSSVAVAVADDVAYVAGRDPGPTHIIDVSDPTDPQTIRQLTTPGRIQDVAVQGEVLYVADDSGSALIYDVTDPANPRYLSSVGAPGGVISIAVTGARMYMSHVSTTEAGMRIVSVRDPRRPVILGTLATPSGVRDFNIDGTTMYLTHGAQFSYTMGTTVLEVFDVGDPASPVLLGTTQIHPEGTYGWALGIDVSGDIAAIVGGSGPGLRIVDISDPSRPRVIGSMPMPGRGFDVDILESVAYVADFDGGWHVVDISSCRPCYADCDRSGSLDVFDFLCFQNLFAAAALEADCDGSGELDFFDFLCFQTAFAAGCD